MVQRMRASTLILVFLLAAAQLATAGARSHPAKMTGAQLVRDMMADPFVDDINHIRRERAMGYIDGVMDSSSGLRWCPAGKSIPHELNYLVTEDIASLPAARLKGSAAELVLDALGRMFPCKATGGTP